MWRFSFAWLLCAHALGAGYVDIMPPQKAAMYKALLPRVWDQELHTILNSPETMWYDEESIVPSYQDSMGDPEGNRPNTIQSFLIDAAVPGGHARLFSKRGRFNFPFATGGADLSDNMVKINFWSAPRHGGQVLPVVYWRLEFSRWRWMFPVGTAIGEVMMVKFSDGDLRVFEVRMRKRTADGWVNSVFRPFPAAWSLADAIKFARPNWEQMPSLRNLVQHLLNENTFTPRTLETKAFPGTFETLSGHLDYIPDFGDPALVKELLKDTPFRSAAGIPWKTNGRQVTYAASTKSHDSIVPRSYDSGLLSVDDVTCRRCHKDAGRGIRDFHFDLILYGELWGEDEIFSWHPFDTKSFVQPSGDVANFNDDNRRLREDFAGAGLVAKYSPGAHPPSVYKEIPRDWKYQPVRGTRRR